jgi:catechol 2,3-dioxygenase-like lactoylglutathione lyase family enzyme
MRLQTVMLYVRDLARMREFYRAMLQVEPVGDDAWTVFDLAGGTRFALHAIPAEFSASPVVVAREESPVKLIFGVEDVAAARARLEAIGAVMIERPWQESGESCDGMDPEGNIFQIASSTRE